MPAYTIVYRNVKGSPLTNSEVDNNFSNLDTFKAPIDSPSFTTAVASAGPVTVNAGVGSLVLTNGGGTTAASMLIKRVGGATDQKTFELSHSGDGSLQLRTVNDAGTSTQSAIGVTRGTGYTLSTLQLMPAGGRTLVGVATDDGVNALQVAGNIAMSGTLNLTSSVSGIEIGALTASATPYTDFHSSGNNLDYDSRIIASGGTSTVGQGTLTFIAATHVFTTSRILVGTSTDDGSGAMIQVAGSINANQGSINSTVYGAGSSIRMRSASGTFSVPAATATGTQVSTLVATGYDGATWRDTASVEAWSEASFTSSSVPSNLRFRTTPTGSVTPTERMRINAAGRVLVNQTTDDGVNQLQVTGGIVAANTTTGTQGLGLVGLNGYSAGILMNNLTTSVGKKYAIYSTNGGALYIDDVTAGINRFLITSAGRVLIGAPGDDGVNVLQVNGSAKIWGNLAATGSLTINRTAGEGDLAIGQNDGYFYGNTTNAGWFSPTQGTWTYSFAQRNLQVQGNNVWHGGNFTPASYMPVSGGTFTGGISATGAIGCNTGNMVTKGWGGNVSAGLIYFGDPGYNHYIYYDGTNFNVSGNFLCNGGTAYSTGNFNPGLYMPLTGGGFTGNVDFYGGLRVLQGGPVMLYSSGNSYACYMRSDPSGIVGFLNGGNNAWNWSVSDGGNVQVRGFEQINGTVGIYSNYGYLTGSGATGAGTTTLPVSLFCPNGRILAQEVDASSDRRLKDNIETLTTERALKFVQTVRPVTFTWKDNSESGTRFGYIAQEVSKAGFDELVSTSPDAEIEETTDEDGFVSPANSRLSINYSQAVPLLTAALANALERITALEALIAGKA